MLLPVLIMPLFFVSDQTTDPKGQRETHIVFLHSVFLESRECAGPCTGRSHWQGSAQHLPWRSALLYASAEYPIHRNLAPLSTEGLTCFLSCLS